MGVHGQAHVAMVSYSIVNGEPAKDPTDGNIAGNNDRYRRCEHAFRVAVMKEWSVNVLQWVRHR